MLSPCTLPGYVDPSAPIPSSEGTRRLIVFIDDYDWGFAAAASASFLDRQAAYVDAMVQLRRLYNRIVAIRDVHGMVVTVNNHRLPLSKDTIIGLLPGFRVYEVPPITPEEFGQFAISAANGLGIHLPSATIDRLMASCDGRLDSVSTFLQTFASGATVGEEDADRFAQFRRTAWQLFETNLSNEQHSVSADETAAHLGLPPHVDYLVPLSRWRTRSGAVRNIEGVVASIWPMNNGQPMVYDGQFGPPATDRDSADRVVEVVTAAAGKRRRKRYVFQEEMRCLGFHLGTLSPQASDIRLMKRLTKWYPRDRFFAYLLASAYAKEGQYLRAYRLPLSRVQASRRKSLLLGKVDRNSITFAACEDV